MGEEWGRMGETCARSARDRILLICWLQVVNRMCEKCERPCARGVREEEEEGEFISRYRCGRLN